MTTGESNVAAAAVILLVALVADDPAILRNAPRDDAPAQSTLWRGDWLEVRGEVAGFLRVYDHRHERPGYIRPTVVRVHRLEPASTPELAAVVRFPATPRASSRWGSGTWRWRCTRRRSARTPRAVGAIGTMADRLAPASARRKDSRDTTLAAHPRWPRATACGSVADAGDGSAPNRLRYDGEAWQRCWRPAAAPLERARAALPPPAPLPRRAEAPTLART
jgi:hypothetical protein